MLAALFLVGGILYRVNLGPDPFSLVLTVVSCSTAASSVFLFLALVSPTEKVMDNLSTVVILFFAMVGGNMVPIDTMPDWMSNFGQFGFNYWANLSFQSIMVENQSLADNSQPVLVLVGISLGLLAVNFLIFRVKSSRGGLA